MAKNKDYEAAKAREAEEAAKWALENEDKLERVLSWNVVTGDPLPNKLGDGRVEYRKNPEESVYAGKPARIGRGKGRRRMSDTLPQEEYEHDLGSVVGGFQVLDPDAQQKSSVKGDLFSKPFEGDESFGNSLADAMMSAAGDLTDTGPTHSELVGMSSVADIQLQRIMHMPTDVRLAIKAILSGERQGISVNKSYLSHGNLDAAQSAFASLTETDPVEFARRIKVPEHEIAGDIKVTQWEDDITGGTLSNPVKYTIPGLVRDSKSVRTAYSMLAKTAEEYMDKGPGFDLAGNFVNPEKADKRDTKFDYTMKALDSLAELYIHPDTRASSIYGTRKEQVKTELAKRLMDMDMTRGGRKESITLPLPAELGIMGLVPNAANWKGYTSPYGRLEYDQFIAGRDELKGDMSEEDRWEIENRLFGKVKPSLRQSLFPSKGKGAYDGGDSKRFMRKANLRAERVRESLLELFPTNQDESQGRKRSAGFYLTEENPNSLQYEVAQAEKMSGIDQLFRQGVEGDIYANQGELSYGMQGDSPISEAIKSFGIPEDTAPTDRVFADTDLGRYQQRIFENPPPAQRTPEWFALREGLVTASQAKKLFGSERDQLNLTKALAKERLGQADEFFQNDPMRQGTQFEERVQRSFMNQAGKNFHLEQAYFETSPELPGVGASPDGMLYDKETGEFEGLLELKLVQSQERMRTAIRDYMPQMQTQMMVTGAHQTHLYVMNARTEEVMHEVIEANPEMQELLRIKAFQVSREAASLDMAGVEKLEEQIKSLPTGKKKRTKKQLDEERAIKAAKKSAEAKYTAKMDEPEEPATAYDPGRKNVHGVYNDSAGSASTTMLAEAMEKAEQNERRKEALGSAQGLPEQPMDGAKKLFEMNKIREDLVRNKQNKEGTLRAANIEGIRAEQEEEGAARASEIEAAYEEQRRAADDASKALREFGKVTKDATSLLTQLGGAVVAGNEGEMNTFRVAASTGLEAENVRGMEWLLKSEQGGMSEQGALNAIQAVGQQTKKFARLPEAAAEFGRLSKDKATTLNENIQNKFDIPDPEVIQNMSGNERLAWAQTQMNKFSDPRERAIVEDMLQIPGLAISKIQDPNDYMTATRDMDEDASRSTFGAIKSVEDWWQDNVTQTLGNAGEVAGTLGSAAVVGGSALAAGYVTVKTVKGAYDILKADKPAVPSSKPSGPSFSSKAMNMAKSLPKAASFSPLGLAVGAGSAVARNAFDVEQGSATDSGMDILEMATLGATVGSFVPGVGTAIGGAVGALGGAAYEAYEYFSGSGDHALPEPKLGQMRGPTNPAVDSSSRTSNVAVNVSISPELVETYVDDNGNKHMDARNTDSLTGMN